jgi:hypothetical protein
LWWREGGVEGVVERRLLVGNQGIPFFLLSARTAEKFEIIRPGLEPVLFDRSLEMIVRPGKVVEDLLEVEKEGVRRWGNPSKGRLTKKRSLTSEKRSLWMNKKMDEKREVKGCRPPGHRRPLIGSLPSPLLLWEECIHLHCPLRNLNLLNLYLYRQLNRKEEITSWEASLNIREQNIFIPLPSFLL